MDLKVVKRYVDRYTKEVVEPGTVLKNVTQERAAELQENQVVTVMKAVKDKEETKHAE